MKPKKELPVHVSPQELKMAETALRRPKKKTPSSVKGNMWLFGGIIAVLLSVALCVFAWKHIPAARTLIGQNPLPNAGQPTPSPSPTPEPGLTIALMGRGGAGHDGGALTDTILIARILETQKKIVLLSIPRDLWVQIPYDGANGTKGKINAAYAIGIDGRNYSSKLPEYSGTNGGGTLAKDVFHTVTGLSIDKYITIDFSGFEQAIDTIGGIDLNVERAFTDYEYPIAGREDWDCAAIASGSAQPAPSTEVSEADLIAQGKLSADNLPDLPKQYPCRYEMLDIAAGQQHMDGKRTLKYVRSRHSAQDGNDFARSRRQKLVIEAIATKLFSLNAFTKIPSFLSTLRSHVDTDLSTPEILGLVPRAGELRGYQMTSLTLSTDNYLTQGYTADRQFALTPITGETNYTAIQDWVATNILPNKKLLYPTIEVTSFWKNATASATLVNSLTAAGYPAKVGTLVMKNATVSATLIYSNTAIDPQTLSTIQGMAHVTPNYLQFASPSAKFQPKADISIFLP